MVKFMETQITAKITENDYVISFIISPIPPGFTTQNAGQYVLIKTKQENLWSEAHPFTLTNSTDDDFLKITVKRIGKFTTALHAAELPVQVLIFGPQGEFGCSIDADNDLVCIAGGIGITPFISLLNHLKESNSDAKITLIWANERGEDLFHLEKFNDLTKSLNLQIVLVINKIAESDSLKSYSFITEAGYVTIELLKKYIDDTNKSFYMCGSPNMQKYIITQLEALQIMPEMIKTEKFGVYMAGAEKGS